MKHFSQTIIHNELFVEEDWGRNRRVLSKFLGNYWEPMSLIMGLLTFITLKISHEKRGTNMSSK